MILDFEETTPEQLGEVLWASFISARLAAEPDLRGQTPRPEWHSQDAATKALWGSFAQRLIALYRRQQGNSDGGPA